MKKKLLTTVAFLFCGLFLIAAGVEGKWEVTIETENGPFSFTAEYKVEGEKLTGVLTSEMGSVDISEGKINGNEIEYTVYLDNYTIRHKGKLEDDKLKIHATSDNWDSEYTMTRVKKE